MKKKMNYYPQLIKKFKEKFFDENLIKQSEHLPKKIEKSLERGKIISKNKDETEVFKLNNFINDCLNIENNINMINIINNTMKKNSILDANKPILN